MRTISTRLLHDNYGIKDSVINVLKSDNYRITERELNGENTRESFLSCSTLYSNNLAPKNAQKLIRAASDSNHLSTISPKSYHAVSTVFRSFSAENDALSASQSSYIMGIDPGIKGAIAIIKIGQTPMFIAVYDMPTFKLKVSGKVRNRIDLAALSFLLDTYSNSTKIALIEDVSSQPQDGHVGAFSFGFSTGAVHGALTMAGIKIEKVKPAVWKSFLGLDSDKSKSIKLAIKLFPTAAKYLTREMDDGRAEAILLGLFAFKHLRKS